jgi:hypothetical protein
MLLRFQDAAHNGLYDMFLFEGEGVELVAVEPHGLLIAACASRLVNLQSFLVFVDF